MLQSTARQIFVAFVNTEIARKFNKTRTYSLSHGAAILVQICIIPAA